MILGIRIFRPRELKNRLEGFLYPDTYEFYQDTSPEKRCKNLLMNLMLKFLTQKFSRHWKTQI